jgi:hypothetical protein
METGTYTMHRADISYTNIAAYYYKGEAAVGRFFSGLARVKKGWRPQQETTRSPLLFLLADFRATSSTHVLSG